MASLPAPVGPSAQFNGTRIEHSEALLKAIRVRVAALGISHEVLDDCAGFAQGYAGKLLADPPIRRLGNLSLFLLLQALGLSIVLVEDDAMLERLKNHRIPRVRPAVLRAPAIVHLTPDFLRSIGAKGGYARAKSLSEKRLSQIGKRGARARWGKPTPASP